MVVLHISITFTYQLININNRIMILASSQLITQTIRQPNNLNLIQYSRNFSVYPYSQIPSKSLIEKF